MAIVIGPLEFEGPYTDSSELREEPGLYALLCESKGEFELIELEEASSLKHCLEAEEYTSNKRFWQEMSQSCLQAAVHYTPELSREQRQAMKVRLMMEFES